MANFYLDTPELKHHLSHPLMKRIVELKERNYADKDNFDYAPIDFEDAMDSYDKVLEIVGEICGDVIAPNAENVDHEGPVCANNRVTYASGGIDGYGYATPFRWTEFPDYSVHHGCRYRKSQ